MRAAARTCASCSGEPAVAKSLGRACAACAVARVMRHELLLLLMSRGSCELSTVILPHEIADWQRAHAPQHPAPARVHWPRRKLRAPPPPTHTHSLPRVFLEERLQQDGAFTDALERDAVDLRTIMGLGSKEAAGIEADVKEKAYRRLLREEVTSGRLDAAPSKAEVLGDLCERVRFDPDVAKQLHESLYKQARRGGMCCSPACMRKRGCLTALRLRCCRSSAACWRRRSCPRRTTPSSSACSGCCASSRWACAGLRAPACLAQRASMAHC